MAAVVVAATVVVDLVVGATAAEAVSTVVEAVSVVEVAVSMVGGFVAAPSVGMAFATMAFVAALAVIAFAGAAFAAIDFTIATSMTGSSSLAETRSFTIPIHTTDTTHTVIIPTAIIRMVTDMVGFAAVAFATVIFTTVAFTGVFLTAIAPTRVARVAVDD
jgi:hypothetical protein